MSEISLNNEVKTGTLDGIRVEIAKRTKRGISFILASIILWSAIGVVWLMPINNMLTRNFLTFCCSALLLPLSFLLSKIIKTEFSAKGNELNSLGMLFSVNQVLYLLLAMWAYAIVPDKMVMIIALIFGAHLLPFSWLYNSKAYFVMSIVISLSVIVLGSIITTDKIFYIPMLMIFTEVIFSGWLLVENRKLINI